MRKRRNSITKAKGTVKWFDDAKGYGFITYKDIDSFLHFSNIRMKGHRTLVEDQSVPLCCQA